MMWVAPIVTGLIVAIIVKVLSINKSKKEIKRANLEYKNAILSTCIGMFCIICILFIYSKDPQALNDANEAASIITAFLLIFSVMSFFITFMHMPVIFDFYDKGIFGIINELEESIIDSINSILFGRLRQKNNNEEKNSDEERKIVSRFFRKYNFSRSVGDSQLTM